MLKDWEKSRLQLLAELRGLRKERDRLASQGSHPATPVDEAARAPLDTLHRVASALTHADALEPVWPEVLRELSAVGGWDAGMAWLISETGSLLGCAGAWSAPGIRFTDLASLSCQATFLPGQDPLGRPWGNGKQPAEVDLKRDLRSPRALYAAQAGLSQALYLPLWNRDALIGFFEFFATEPFGLHGPAARVLEVAGQMVVQGLLRDRAQQQGRGSDSLMGTVNEVAVIELDASGRIVRWGKDAERLEGFEAGEVLGRHLSVLYPAADGERAGHNLASAAMRGIQKDGGWRVRKDSVRFWADVLILPKRAPHGELMGFTKVVQATAGP